MQPTFQITDNVQRGNYATLTDKDVAHFEQLLGKNFVLTEDLEGYNICFLKRIRGRLCNQIHSHSCAL